MWLVQGRSLICFKWLFAFYRGKSSYKLPFGKNIFKDSPSPPSKSKIMHCCPFGISDSLTQSGVMESMNHLWSLWLSVSLMDVRGPCRCEGILRTKKGSRNSELAFKLGTLNMTTFVICIISVCSPVCTVCIRENLSVCPMARKSWTSKWPKHHQKNCFWEYNFWGCQPASFILGIIAAKNAKKISLPPPTPNKRGLTANEQPNTECQYPYLFTLAFLNGPAGKLRYQWTSTYYGINYGDNM